VLDGEFSLAKRDVMNKSPGIDQFYRLDEMGVGLKAEID
jgi:hypothetical protein